MNLISECPIFLWYYVFRVWHRPLCYVETFLHCSYRCNLAVMLLTDIVVDGVEVDWSIHVPLMLHMLFLGLDHSRALVHEHCKQLLLNLLVVLSDHCDHLTVARVLLAAKTQQLALGVPKPQLPIHTHNFTGNFQGMFYRNWSTVKRFILLTIAFVFQNQM